MKPSFFLEILETFLMSFIILMLTYWLLAVPEKVVGASMEPTFYTGDRILVEKITKHFKKYERGDIVVLHPPGDDNTDYVKRIVGVPGDIVKIHNCNVYISRDDVRFELEEPYLFEGTCTTDGSNIKEGRSLRIEESKYLVLGDNRRRSLDSRVFGFIEEGRIMGRVVFRFWPLGKAELF